MMVMVSKFVYSMVENHKETAIVLMQMQWMSASVNYSTRTHTTPIWLGMRLSKTKCIEFIIGLNETESLLHCYNEIGFECLHTFAAIHSTKLHAVAVSMPLSPYSVFTTFLVRISTKSWIHYWNFTRCACIHGIVARNTRAEQSISV